MVVHTRFHKFYGRSFARVENVAPDEFCAKSVTFCNFHNLGNITDVTNSESGPNALKTSSHAKSAPPGGNE